MEENEKNGVGRPPRYLTIEKFEKFLTNDFHGLKLQVKTNTIILWIIIGCFIAASLIDRFD